MMDQKGAEENSRTDWRFYLAKGTSGETRGISSFVVYDGDTLRQAIHSFCQDDRYAVDQIIGITPGDGRFDGLSKIETIFALKAYSEQQKDTFK